jgi:hypothetical protein
MTAMVLDLITERQRRGSAVFCFAAAAALSLQPRSAFSVGVFATILAARLTWLKFSSKTNKLYSLKWFKIRFLFPLSRVRSLPFFFSAAAAAAMDASQRCVDAFADLKKRKQPTHVLTWGILRYTD